MSDCRSVSSQDPNHLPTYLTLACLRRAPATWSPSCSPRRSIPNSPHPAPGLSNRRSTSPTIHTIDDVRASSMYLTFPQQSLVLPDLLLPHSALWTSQYCSVLYCIRAHWVLNYRLYLSQCSISFRCLVSPRRCKFFPHLFHQSLAPWRYLFYDSG